MASASVRGLDDVVRRMNKLAGAEAKKVMRQAMRANMKTVQAKAKELAPVETGLLRKNIKVRAGRGKRGVIKILVSVGDKNFVGETFYGGMQEFGTKKMEGKHFMERAFDATAEAVKDKTEKDILIGLENLATNG